MRARRFDRAGCRRRAAIGVPHAVAEMALAHAVGSSVERSHPRSDLFDKRRGLMEQWAQYVLGGGAKVVRLRR